MTDKYTDSKRGIIVVCGATGRQGGATTRKLLRDGWQVRALTRNPGSAPARALAVQGATLVQANLDDPTSLDNALDGAHGVFGVTDFWEHGFDKEIRMGSNLIECAKRADIGHFVFSSVGATERTKGLGITHFEAKAEIEDRLLRSGLSWTILRPVTFMENIITPRFRRAICERGILRFGFNRQRTFQMVAMDDLAVFAALAFDDDPRVKGRTTEIASDAFTMDEWAQALGVQMKRPVKYSVVTPAQLHVASAFIAITGRQALYKAGPSLINQFRWNNNSPIGGWDADIEQLRSIHPAMLTLKDWIKTIDWTKGLNSKI